MKRLVALLALAWCLVSPAYAGLVLSSGMIAHTHADANTGGSVLDPTSVVVDPKSNVAGTPAIIVQNTGASPGNYVVNVAALGYTTNLATTAATAGFALYKGPSATSAYLRWLLALSSGLELGGNSGSDLELNCYDDTGGSSISGCTTLLRFRRLGTAPGWTGPEIDISGKVVSTKSCAAGYTRLTPNYCVRSGSAVTVATLSTATCTQTTALPGVTDAYGVELQIDTVNTSANTVGSRLLDGYVYAPTDTTCGTILFDNANRTFEYVATAAGTQINQKTSIYKAVSSATGQVYVDAQVALSGTSPTVTYRVLGYYD